MRGHAIKLIEEFEVMDESLSKSAGGGAWKQQSDVLFVCSYTYIECTC